MILGLEFGIFLGVTIPAVAVTVGGMTANQFNMAKPKQSKPVKRRSALRKLLSVAVEEGVIVSPDGQVTRPGSIEALLRRRKQRSLPPVYLTKQIVQTSRIKPSDVVSLRSRTKGRVAVADLPVGPSLEELMREALDRSDPEFIERFAKTMRGVKNRDELRELDRELTALTTRTTRFHQGGKVMTRVERACDTKILEGNVWGRQWVTNDLSPKGLFPRYYKHAGDERVAVPAKDVPAKTQLHQQEFKLATPGVPYTLPTAGAWAKPGRKLGYVPIVTRQARQ